VTPNTDNDAQFLQQAMRLSELAISNPAKGPFGAILVHRDEVVGQGTNSVIELSDPSAHAEVMALRDAGSRLRQHRFEGAVLYASSEPCPMCLTACYWAGVSRIVFGATTADVATYGFEDLRLYGELREPAERRSVREDNGGEPLRYQATAILRAWAAQSEPADPG